METTTSKRVKATLIDYTLMFGLFIYLIVELGYKNDEGGYTLSGWLNTIPLSIWFLYFPVAEYFLGGTLGHQLYKLKVISANYQPLTFYQVFLRRISDALEISWCFGLIAYILVKNTPHNQRLGDLWAKTLVIGSDKELKTEEIAD
jgi:uncharacterized RDD family membrane protein YckC